MRPRPEDQGRTGSRDNATKEDEEEAPTGKGPIKEGLHPYHPLRPPLQRPASTEPLFPFCVSPTHVSWRLFGDWGVQAEKWESPDRLQARRPQPPGPPSAVLDVVTTPRPPAYSIQGGVRRKEEEEGERRMDRARSANQLG